MTEQDYSTKWNGCCEDVGTAIGMFFLSFQLDAHAHASWLVVILLH
jgi:hypothetical protein